MTIKTGKRQVRVWNSDQWVSVLQGAEKNTYRVIPEAGDEFVVAAATEDELNDRISARLRSRTEG